ncbi:KpsF/GutQ family sugar-phosphate isomerase [Moheibacter lacus]|uniref:KpsF/GutQ family sugar-phosphate isomerase n=1 Tax=Moheibacter lacus TaxID=2745851 RepID=A0A838ZNQ9_9FLAO|nr:KpsF/GutQ family sugar-phosphate isomerase [Moheibacter lacus]MBA5629366.1 KpsF/GutQ family sugar-phosphate isomerase [Moheibacter lacus]
MKNQEICEFGKVVFQDEITELLSIAQNLGDEFAHAVTLLHEITGKVVVVGIGKSAHIANKMVATFNSTGTKSQFLHAAEAIHGDLGLLDKEDVVICVSKSGNSQEIKDLAPILKKNASALIAMTGNLESDLAKHADVILNISVSKEACPNNLAPTSSTTAQLVMGDALAVALMRWNHFGSDDFAKFHPGGALGKRLLWSVEDVMDTFQRPFVNPNSTVFEVIDSLTSGRNGITVVLEESEILGVITDGDLRRMLQKHKEYQHLLAKDMLTAHPKIVYKDEKAVDAFHKLRDFNIGQLVVVNRDEQYFGILDLHALIKHGIEI